LIKKQRIKVTVSGRGNKTCLSQEVLTKGKPDMQKLKSIVRKIIGKGDQIDEIIIKAISKSQILLKVKTSMLRESKDILKQRARKKNRKQIKQDPTPILALTIKVVDDQGKYDPDEYPNLNINIIGAVNKTNIKKAIAESSYTAGWLRRGTLQKQENTWVLKKPKTSIVDIEEMLRKHGATEEQLQKLKTEIEKDLSKAKVEPKKYEQNIEKMIQAKLKGIQTKNPLSSALKQLTNTLGELAKKLKTIK